MRLDLFDNINFQRGASRSKEFCWLVFSGCFFSTWLPGSRWRISFLRMFGAHIGQNVVIKPHVRIKFPWRLTVGNFCWIGEGVWIDNLASVSLGDHVCLSQGAYFCTGSHDWSRRSFDLIVKPIRIDSHAWVGAKSYVGPGVCIGEGTVLSFGSTATRSLPSWAICSGNPANLIKKRQVSI